MAQPIACDICSEENAVQMLTNLTTGEVLCMGPACLPVFYGQSVLGVMDAGEHKGLPQKCQACRRVHERMTLAGRPATDMDRPHQGEHDPGAEVDAGDGHYRIHPEDTDGPEDVNGPAEQAAQ
jgi:hypothetical protein